jgi:hypothetical protein
VKRWNTIHLDNVEDDKYNNDNLQCRRWKQYWYSEFDTGLGYNIAKYKY